MTKRVPIKTAAESVKQKLLTSTAAKRSTFLNTDYGRKKSSSTIRKMPSPGKGSSSSFEKESLLAAEEKSTDEEKLATSKQQMSGKEKQVKKYRSMKCID